MKLTTTFALLAFETTAITITLQDNMTTVLEGAASFADSFVPAAIAWWKDLTKDTDGVLTFHNGFAAWNEVRGGLAMTNEEVGCAYVKAKGSEMPFFDNIPTDDCTMNESEFVAGLIFAYRGNIYCTDDELAEVAVVNAACF